MAPDLVVEGILEDLEFGGVALGGRHLVGREASVTRSVLLAGDGVSVLAAAARSQGRRGERDDGGIGRDESAGGIAGYAVVYIAQPDQVWLRIEFTGRRV